MRKFSSAVIYYTLNILLFPAYLVGYVLTMQNEGFARQTFAEETLRKIASTSKGGIAAFDYYTSEVLESKALYMRAVRASLKAGGEPLKFGVDSAPPSRERLAEFLQSCGLSLSEQRTLGEETGGKRAWGGFAIADVK